MNKRVEGSYIRVEDAMHAVQRLRDEGYSKNDISVVANSTVKDSIPHTMDAEVSTDAGMRENMQDDDRSLWDKIKDAFTMDDYETERRDQPGYDANNDPLSQYHDDIEKGNVIVLVDESAKPSTSMDTDTTTDAGVMGGGMGAFGPSAPLDTAVASDNAAFVYEPVTGMDVDNRDMNDKGVDNRRMNDNDKTIELREESLDVDKNKVQTGEVKIGKRVVEETRDMEVPVTHEEVTIERHAVTDRDASTTPITDTDDMEEIVVPVTEEQLNVTKRTEVVEEVDIHKDEVTENKHVTDTVRKEELDVDRDGDITVEDNRGKMTPDMDNDSNGPL